MKYNVPKFNLIFRIGIFHFRKNLLILPPEKHLILNSCGKLQQECSQKPLIILLVSLSYFLKIFDAEKVEKIIQTSTNQNSSMLIFRSKVVP